MTDTIILVFRSIVSKKNSHYDFTIWMNSWIGDLLVADYDNLSLYIDPTFEEYHISIPTNQMKQPLSNPKLRLQIHRHRGANKFELSAILHSNKPWSLITCTVI